MKNYDEGLKKIWFNKSFEVEYRMEKAIAAMTEVCGALRKARTPRKVREAYNKAGVWRLHLFRLRDHPREFLAAKRSPRFPRPSRPSSKKKRVRYLARAMAGTHLGLCPATSFSLLESYKMSRRGRDGTDGDVA